MKCCKSYNLKEVASTKMIFFFEKIRTKFFFSNLTQRTRQTFLFNIRTHTRVIPCKRRTVISPTPSDFLQILTSGTYQWNMKNLSCQLQKIQKLWHFEIQLKVPYFLPTSTIRIFCSITMVAFSNSCSCPTLMGLKFFSCERRDVRLS